MAAFLRRTLPANGFVLTADDTATLTLTFAGYGWTGVFTGSTGVLSPAVATGLRAKQSPI